MIKKNKLLIIFIVASFLSVTFATIGYMYEPDDVEEVSIDTNTFIPDVDLMNEEMWTRVSEFRFESKFLRLAVEWCDGEYLLSEMDGEKMIMSRSPMYSVISYKITELTLN